MYFQTAMPALSWRDELLSWLLTDILAWFRYDRSLQLNPSLLLLTDSIILHTNSRIFTVLFNVCSSFPYPSSPRYPG